jgi:hypothetical protein
MSIVRKPDGRIDVGATIRALEAKGRKGMPRTYVLILEVTDDGRTHESPEGSHGYLLTDPQQAGRFIKHAMDLDPGITVRVVWATETI